MQNIESRILALKIFPEMYPKKMWDFRVITFKTYLVFYKFNRKKWIVFIYRLFSCSQDYIKNI